MKLHDIFKHFQKELSYVYDVDEAQALFFITLDNLLGYNKSSYLINKDKNLTLIQIESFELVLKDLKLQKPIQYILEEAYFYGLKFKVNESVLIPRPETEELVEWILETLKNGDIPLNNNLLDIGTGSGCIAISLKKHLSTSNVYALDIAMDSVLIAKENATRNNVEVSFIVDDILNPKTTFKENKLDVIVSNPPYIKEDERNAMNANVLEHEPHRALFVSNENPLIFYNAIADFAIKNLNSDGLLFFEINEYLGKETVALLEGKGFTNIYLRKDMQGKDRMIKASLLN
ncbi:MAG: peptide chain release factor N(5)-glutamine methyltransferase [Pedobacter sp.]|nr:MAG: peptide chain release factor N(5)-glutamine methyltransferase [Pedobacter sp.]